MFSCEECGYVKVATKADWIDHLLSKGHQDKASESLWSWSDEINWRSIVVTATPDTNGEFGELPDTIFDLHWYLENFGVINDAFLHPKKKFCIILLDDKQFALKIIETFPSTIKGVPVILQLKANLAINDWVKLSASPKPSACIPTENVEKIETPNKMFHPQKFPRYEQTTPNPHTKKPRSQKVQNDQVTTPSSMMFQQRHRWIAEQILHLDYDSQMDRFITLVTMLPYDFNKREQVRQELVSLYGQGYQVIKMIGMDDVITGLGDSESILNLSVELQVQDQNPDTKVISKIYQSLKARNGFKDLSLDVKANINGTHCATGVKFQLCFNNFLHAQTSKLIQFLVSLDARVLPLMLVIRHWAAYNMQCPDSIENYILELLVIVFLNTCKILPNVAFLQAKSTDNVPLVNNFWNVNFCTDHYSISEILCYSGRAPVENSNITGKPTTRSILMLAKDFFQMYASVDFGQTAVCSLLGNFLEKSDLDITNKNAILSPFLQSYISWSQLQKRGKKMKISSPLCVQDPFELSRNVATNVSESSLLKFQDACRNSARVLERLENGFNYNCNFLDILTMQEENGVGNYFHSNKMATPTKQIWQTGVKRRAEEPPSTSTMAKYKNDLASYRTFSRGQNSENSWSYSGTQMNDYAANGKGGNYFYPNSTSDNYDDHNLVKLEPPVKIKRDVDYSYSEDEPYIGNSSTFMAPETESYLSQPYPQRQSHVIPLPLVIPTKKKKRKRSKKRVHDESAESVNSSTPISKPIPCQQEATGQQEATATGQEKTAGNVKTNDEGQKKKVRSGKSATAPDGIETFELRLNHIIKADFSYCFNFMFANVATKEEVDQKCTALWMSFFKDFFNEVWTTSFNLSVEPYDCSDVLAKLNAQRPNTKCRDAYTKKQIVRLEKHMGKNLGTFLADKLVNLCESNSGEEKYEDNEEADLTSVIKNQQQYTKDNNPYQAKFEQIPQCEEFCTSVLVHGCMDAFHQYHGFGLLQKSKKGKQFVHLPPLEGHGKFHETILHDLKPDLRTGVDKKFIATAKVDTTKNPMEILTIFTELPDCQEMSKIFFSMFPQIRGILCQYVCYRLEQWLKLK